VLLTELDIIVKILDHVGKQIIGLVKNGNMIKFIKLLLEAKKETFEEFAKTRGKGAKSIAENAQSKGGLAMLTYNHFNVKAPYYDKAAKGKFDVKQATTEFNSIKSSISLNMTPTEFQKQLGKLEVLGELIIRNKK
jgi:hypothetical protein